MGIIGLMFLETLTSFRRSSKILVSSSTSEQRKMLPCPLRFTPRGFDLCANNTADVAPVSLRIVAVMPAPGKEIVHHKKEIIPRLCMTSSASNRNGIGSTFQSCPRNRSQYWLKDQQIPCQHQRNTLLVFWQEKFHHPVQAGLTQ